MHRLASCSPKASISCQHVIGRGPDQAEGLGIHYNKQRQRYTVPFMMAPVNTRVVRRSNALLHHSYGSDFSFEEVQEVPNGVVALIILAVYVVTVLLFMLKPLHPIFRRVLPYVGADPVKLAEAPKGYWKSVMIGETEEASGKAPQLVTMHLKGEGDPGYWETSRFLLEAGLCLALQDEELKDSSYKQGGILTPGSAMGMILAERVQRAMGTFKIED